MPEGMGELWRLCADGCKHLAGEWLPAASAAYMPDLDALELELTAECLCLYVLPNLQ
jgi:hypothetical protein